MSTKNRTIRTQKQTSQQEIVLANAGELFWENGFRKTNIKQLAEKCGFEPGNLYYYFKNKEHILFEVLKTEIMQVVSAVEYLKDDNTMSPAERLRTMIKKHVEIATARPYRSSSLLFDTGLKEITNAHRQAITKIRDSYDATLRQIILDGIDSGDFAQVNVKIAGIAIASAILRTRLWFTTEGELSASQLGDILADLALNMLKSKGRG